MRNIAILTLNDLGIAFKNKTLYLVLFIPLFVFVALELVDENGTDVRKINIGLIAERHYEPLMVRSLQSADSIFEISWHPNEEAGRQWLRDRQGDGILIPAAKSAEGCALIVLTESSIQTVAIVESVSRLQRAMEGNNGEWIADIQSIQESAIQRQMLPTWILMLVLLVGFIVLPAQVAEEKEKKLLLGLLQTPIHEAEWLLAKVSYGTFLIVIAALFLHVLTGLDFDLRSAVNYLAFLVAGGFCFSSFGVLVGFLCRTQASARTLGVLFYLPHLLPSALADFSKPLNTVAPFIPSYQFYRPIKLILLEDGGVSFFSPELLALVGVGLITSLSSYLLMKKRWLM